MNRIAGNSTLLPRILFVALLGIATTGLMAAEAKPDQAPVQESPLLTEYKLREEAVAAVLKGGEAIGDVTARLRFAELKGEQTGIADAEYALTLIRIGHRLLGAGKPDEAGFCFAIAEEYLARIVKEAAELKITDGEKARYLEKLAHIRANFLNKAAQARSDIDEAMALQPRDRRLGEVRAQLARGRSADFADKKEGK